MTFIIADACVNWRNLAEADELIECCADAGVDAVKFQAYKTFAITDDDLSDFGNALENKLHLNNIILTPEKVRYLYFRCLHHGVEFMCTPMYPEAVDMLAPYVKTWKVRYQDRNNIDILQKIYALNQKVLISTDGESQQIEKHPNSYYLFCVPEYPPTAIPHLDCFKGFDGYSCHIPVVNHIILANKLYNFKYLEVHASLTSIENYEPLDIKVSLNIDDLYDLVEKIRNKGGGLLNDDKNWV